MFTLNGLANVHHRRRSVEFQVLPTQTKDLAGAQTASQPDKDGCFQAIPTGGVKQRGCLVRGERSALFGV